jgi:hypothetical protein
MLGINLQGHEKLQRRKAETLKAKGRRELGGERSPRVGEKQGMTTTRGMNPFLKTDSPARALKRHGRVSPDAHQGTHPMAWGARPRMSYSLPAGAKKANRRARSMLPPRDRCAASSSPRPTVQPQAWGLGPHIRRLACRFLCAEKTDRRVRSTPPPVVAHLFTSAKSNSPVSDIGA